MVEYKPMLKLRHGGFTLIEILIVVVILGILAGIVIANVSSASKQSRESVLREELRFMRSEIGIFQAAHAAAPSGPEATFTAQMTGFTDFDGNVSPTPDGTFRYGPYLSQMPRDPFTGKDSLKVLPGQTPDGSGGWVYNPTTLEFYVDLATYGPTGLNW